MPRPLALIALFLLVAGCGGESRDATGLEPVGPLRVAAASDLQAAFPALAEAFLARTGTRVEASFGSSGQLSQQIEQGAPFGVFLAANRQFVADLASNGAVEPDSVRDYARGSLVLAVSKAADPGIASLDDLRKPEVKRIAIANPDTAPYGRAAKQALEGAGLWGEIAPKIVRGESVRQALQFVQTGNAECGLVGLAIANVEEIRALPVEDSLYDPLVQALGVTREGRNRPAAAEFAEFVTSEDSQVILSKYGFKPPPEGESKP